MDQGSLKAGEVGTAPEKCGADLVVPIIAGGFAVYFLASTWQLVWEARINGLLICIPLLLLVTIKIGAILFRSIKGRASLGLGELVVWNDHQRKRLLLVALLAVQILTMEWLGITLSVLLVMLLSMIILGVRSKAQLILVPLITAFSIYFMFIVLLNERIPLGPIENTISALRSGGGV